MSGITNGRIPQVGLVGPCASGKSTLINTLRGRYRVEMRHIFQEHSYVPDMWQRINKPDWLVFLDVSYPVTLQRRNLNWTEAEYQEQEHRLAHARQHADLYILTDDLTPEQVADRVAEFFNRVGVEAADG